MKNGRRLKKSLIYPIINGIILLIMILSANVGITGYIEFSQVLSEQYMETANGIAKFVTMELDISTLDKYLKPEDADEDYNQFRGFLMDIVYAEDCQVIYVAKVDLENKEREYVFNASKNEADAEIYQIGYRYALKDSFIEIYQLMLQGEEDAYNSTYQGKDKSFGSYMHSIAPVRGENGEIVAIVGVVKTMKRFDAARKSFIGKIILIELVLAALCGITWIFYMKKRIVSPIQQVSTAAEKMIEHLEDGTAPEIKTKRDDEIKVLADSFTTMYREIGDYIRKLGTVMAEKERIGAELDVASKIQTSMLPCIFPPFPNRTEFDIYATMNPAKEVGGDFYDFFMVDEDNIAFVVADVSGKGVPAALFMVIGKTLIKDHTGMHEDLGDVFTEVNNILCSSNSEEMFITAFEGVLNVKTGELRYVNAGHEMPFIRKKGGKYEPIKLRRGFVLAGMEGVKYKGGSLQLEPGDSIFQYSDGVPEATNISVEQYGMARLEKILAENSEKNPKELLDSVKSDMNTFVGEAEQFDDITMLCLCYNGPKDNA